MIGVLSLICLKVGLFLRLVYVFTNIFTRMLFVAPSRFKLFSSSLSRVKSLFNLDGAVNFLIISLLLTIASQNVLGSIPGVVNSNLYYFLTCSVSLIV